VPIIFDRSTPLLHRCKLIMTSYIFRIGQQLNLYKSHIQLDQYIYDRNMKYWYLFEEFTPLDCQMPTVHECVALFLDIMKDSTNGVMIYCQWYSHPTHWTWHIYIVITLWSSGMVQTRFPVSPCQCYSCHTISITTLSRRVCGSLFFYTYFYCWTFHSSR